MPTKAYILDSIVSEASEMMHTFFHPPKRILDAQWQDQYKKRAMKLLWQCHSENITAPVDLVCLVGCLFGERHNWPYAKFAVVNYLALNYSPMASTKEFPRGLKSRINEIIVECGGSKKLPKHTVLDPRSDYRRNIDSWLKDEAFMQMWAFKYHYFKTNPPNIEALESVKKALAKKD